MTKLVKKLVLAAAVARAFMRAEAANALSKVPARGRRSAVPGN